MASLRRNVAANLASGLWIAVLTLIVTPVQEKLLGIEAYAVIGLVTTLQVMLSIFDFGLASTLTREIARDQSAAYVASRPLIQTAVSIYWLMALVIGTCLVVAAGPMTHLWFREHETDSRVLTYAMQVVAVFLALRWPVAMYSGVLAGAQRMDVLNLAKGGLTSLRLVGGLLVVVFFRDLTSFLHWTVLAAVLEVVAYATICHRVLPQAGWLPGFSLTAVRQVWAFSLSMNGLAIITILLTQVDRVFISHMLPLEALGFYAIAYQAATSISLLLTSTSTALMPSLAEAHSAGERTTLLARYEAATRGLLFVSGTVLFMLLFFGEPLLELWVSRDVADNAWLPLAFLAAGFWLSAAGSCAYTAAIACGYAGRMLAISAASVVPYLVALYVFVDHWGILGAALAWAALNLAYLFSMVPIAHRQVLAIPYGSWLWRTVLPLAALGTALFGTARVIAVAIGFDGKSALILLLPAVAAYVVLGYFFAGSAIRSLAEAFSRRVVSYTGIAS